MNKTGLLFTTCLLFCLSATGPAGAAIYEFTYSGSLSGDLFITTDDTLDAVFGYDITGVSGTFAGSTITGLFNNPNQPLPSSNSSFTWDNVLFPGGAMAFDRYGIAFTTSIDTYNLFDAIADDSGGTAETPYGMILLSTGTAGETYGTGTLAAVPGPTVGAGASSFALGALFLGWLARRRGHRLV